MENEFKAMQIEHAEMKSENEKCKKAEQNIREEIKEVYNIPYILFIANNVNL